MTKRTPHSFATRKGEGQIAKELQSKGESRIFILGFFKNKDSIPQACWMAMRRKCVGSEQC